MQQTPIALSIIIAGALVAGTIFLVNAPDQRQAPTFGNNNSPSAENVRAVDPDVDHILGGADAKAYIIEYSDLECPFCARFHPTVSRVIDDFGGEVAWVFRHFPLTSIHSRAQRAAVVSECVAELGGNDAFFAFIDQVFINQRQLGDELYLRLADELGIAAEPLIACIDSGRYDQKVADDLANAAAAGGRGTPFTIVVNDAGDVFPFSGALPYAQVRSIVEQALE